MKQNSDGEKESDSESEYNDDVDVNDVDDEVDDDDDLGSEDINPSPDDEKVRHKGMKLIVVYGPNLKFSEALSVFFAQRLFIS